MSNASLWQTHEAKSDRVTTRTGSDDKSRGNGEHTGAGTGSRKGTRRASADIGWAGRACGRISAVLGHYPVDEPWRTDGGARVTGSCWFVRLAHQAPDEATRYALTCYHCVSGALASAGIAVEAAALRGRMAYARPVLLMPDVDAALLELAPADPELADDAEAHPEADLSALRAWPLGDDRVLHDGQHLATYGYPLGQDQLKTSYSRLTGRDGALLQLDGSINFGNSGGPVVRHDRGRDGNERAFVVGYVVKGLPDANAVSFAQPISALVALMSRACSEGIPAAGQSPRVIRAGKLGATFASMSSPWLAALASDRTANRTFFCIGSASPSSHFTPRRRHYSAQQFAVRDNVTSDNIENNHDDGDYDSGDDDDNNGDDGSTDGDNFSCQPVEHLVDDGVGHTLTRRRVHHADGALALRWLSRGSPLRGLDARRGDVLLALYLPWLRVGPRVALGGDESSTSTVRPEHACAVDRHGRTRVPWSDDTVPLDAAISAVPRGERVGVDMLRVCAPRGDLAMRAITLRPTRAHGWFRPCLPYERARAIVFAGLVVGTMDARVVAHFPALAARLSPAERDRPAIVLLKVYAGTPFDAASAGTDGEGSQQAANGDEDDGPPGTTGDQFADWANELAWRRGSRAKKHGGTGAHPQSRRRCTGARWHEYAAANESGTYDFDAVGPPDGDANIVEGDRIIAVGGQPVATLDAFVVALTAVIKNSGHSGRTSSGLIAIATDTGGFDAVPVRDALAKDARLAEQYDYPRLDL